MSDGNSTKICTFPKCGRDRVAKGLCQTHRRQQMRGEELGFIHPKRPDGTLPNIEYDEAPCPVPGLEGSCHIPRLSLDGKGYGQVSDGKKTKRIHKYVWERDVGPVEEGKELDHMCMVKSCCNVKHLRQVPHKVNSTENLSAPPYWKINAMKTHCKHGHEFTPENTRTRRHGKGRQCIACEKINDRKKQARRVAAKPKQA